LITLELGIENEGLEGWTDKAQMLADLRSLHRIDNVYSIISIVSHLDSFASISYCKNIDERVPVVLSWRGEIRGGTFGTHNRKAYIP